MDEITIDGTSYMCITEYAVIKRVYDLDAIAEDYPEITSIDTLIPVLKKDLLDFSEYEVEGESGNIQEYSTRKYTVIFRTESKTYDKDFSDYSEAEDYFCWLENCIWDEDIIADVIEWRSNELVVSNKTIRVSKVNRS